MVIRMNEKPQKKITTKAPKKDMYTAVLVAQIASVLILMLTFTVSVKGNATALEELKEILSEEKFTMGDIISTVRQYLSADNSWAVFGDNVSYVYKEDDEAYTTETSEQNQTDDYISLTGSGGEDLELYEAADNTSFSPFKITSPAVAPIDNGRYTSYFGYRISPITGESSFHTGLDIAASEGTKIRAVLSGRVLRTGEDDRAGKYIFLEHSDGFVTFYCHCSEITAEVGAVIRQGETIAKVGSTGWSTGPHLHFEVRKNNIRYNPLFILADDTSN